MARYTLRVLVVEDDVMIANAVVATLVDRSFAVDWVQDGSDALVAVATHCYDIVLLDLGLPGLSGLEVLKQVRADKIVVPVIVLTAQDSVEDRVRGLNLGADDYIVKPFAMKEVMARINSALRRSKGQLGSPSNILSNTKLTLDPEDKILRCAQGTSHQLSSKQYMLLEALLERPGAILSRGQLEEKLYGWGSEVESNAIEFLIHSIRKKVGKDAIKNVRGLGWCVSK